MILNLFLGSSAASGNTILSLATFFVLLLFGFGFLFSQIPKAKQQEEEYLEVYPSTKSDIRFGYALLVFAILALLFGIATFGILFAVVLLIITYNILVKIPSALRLLVQGLKYLK